MEVVPGHEVTQEQLATIAALVQQAEVICDATSESYGTVVLQELLSCHQQNKMQRLHKEWQESNPQFNGMGAVPSGYSRL